VYDYVAHHLLRCTVLGLPVAEATQHEIGSRRASERLGRQEAHARYVDDLATALEAWTRTLVPGGFVALVIGDGQIGSGVVRVLPLLERAAARAGLGLRATLSQARPTFGPADKTVHKEEHLAWLERAGA
jgi:hypothetical protein